MKLNHKEILDLEKYCRINLINQISGLKSVNLIGSSDDSKVSNLGIFNSVVHVGANPPCLGFIMRPLLTDRDTYSNIKSNGFFTLNLVHKDIYVEAHHTSAKYPSEISEFNFTDLSETYIDDFPAPFVEECKIKIGLSFLEEHQIKFNDTIFIVGKIELLVVDDEVLEEDGHINHDLADTIAVAGLDTYYSCNKLSREKFARPKEIAEKN